MMMALVVITVSVAVLMAGVPSATAESTWILGGKGEACNLVCEGIGKRCNKDRQSTITSKESFEVAYSEAGHQMCEDKYVTQRKYAGAPFVADDGKTCVFLTKGAKSVCTPPLVPDHKPLCYCEPIPVHCKWTPWVVVDECSKSCGVGIQIMTRTKLVEAANGGKDCYGKYTEERKCNTHECPDPIEQAIMVMRECLKDCGDKDCTDSEVAECQDRHDILINAAKESEPKKNRPLNRP